MSKNVEVSLTRLNTLEVSFGKLETKVDDLIKILDGLVIDVKDNGRRLNELEQKINNGISDKLTRIDNDVTELKKYQAQGKVEKRKHYLAIVGTSFAGFTLANFVPDNVETIRSLLDLLSNLF